MRSFSLEFREYYSQFVHFPKKTDKNFAVVFSPFRMLDSGLGEKIDSFDRVMRFNFAPTIGFEKDIGSKTTHRLMQPSVRFREKEEECFTYETPRMVPLKFHLQDSRFWQQGKYQEFYEHFHIISHYLGILSSAFVKKITKEDYQYFSTGLWGLFYAIACSEKPTLFGWENWNDRAKSTKGHYFKTLQVVEKNPHFLEESREIILNSIKKSLQGKEKVDEKLQMHDFSLEKEIILKMHRLKLIEIHGFSSNT